MLILACAMGTQTRHTAPPPPLALVARPQVTNQSIGQLSSQVEGFPDKNELKTVYVEHDIDSEEADTPSVEFVANSLKAEGVTRDEVAKMLTSVGFTEEYQNKAVGSLSGGWKMKLALARAILQKAQILLLDGGCLGVCV